MTTDEIIISKCNSIRFAVQDDLMPSFDNRLSYEEDFDIIPTRQFSQIIFNKSTKLIQIKAGLTAVVTLVKTDTSGNETTILLPDVTTYPTFKIYDYLVAFSTIECVYFEVKESGITKHKSEWQNIIEYDATYKMVQWSNLDLLSNSFEFDYLTTLAKANVNFMIVKGRVLEYQPSGEETVYDNQDSVEIIKASYSRGLLLELDVLPRQVAEILGLATRHDQFQVNEVACVAKEIPDFDMFGSAIQFKASLTQPDILGINTHDIGYDCDSTKNKMIENKGFEDATGSDSALVTEGYGLTQIVAKTLSGTPSIKVGYTVGGEEIVRTRPIGSQIMIDSNRFTPNLSGAWTIYFEISGGITDVYFQTIMFNNQP